MMNTFLAALPTTNLRIFATVCLVTVMVLTETVVFIVTHVWHPIPLELLSFLILYAGLDVAQFHSKRTTTFAPTGSKATEETST